MSSRLSPDEPLGPLWRDEWAVAFAVLGLALVILLSLDLWNRFPLLPQLIPVHFNAFGDVDLIGAKRDIFRLPIIGAMIWVVNGVLAVAVGSNDRVLARLLLAAAVLVQLLFGIAAYQLIG